MTLGPRGAPRPTLSSTSRALHRPVARSSGTARGLTLTNPTCTRPAASTRLGKALEGGGEEGGQRKQESEEDFPSAERERERGRPAGTRSRQGSQARPGAGRRAERAREGRRRGLQDPSTRTIPGQPRTAEAAGLSLSRAAAVRGSGPSKGQARREAARAPLGRRAGAVFPGDQPLLCAHCTRPRDHRPGLRHRGPDRAAHYSPSPRSCSPPRRSCRRPSATGGTTSGDPSAEEEQRAQSVSSWQRVRATNCPPAAAAQNGASARKICARHCTGAGPSEPPPPLSQWERCRHKGRSGGLWNGASAVRGVRLCSNGSGF